MEERSAALERRGFWLEILIAVLIVFELFVGIMGLRDHSTVDAIRHLETTIPQTTPAAVPKAP